MKLLIMQNIKKLMRQLIIVVVLLNSYSFGLNGAIQSNQVVTLIECPEKLTTKVAALISMNKSDKAEELLADIWDHCWATAIPNTRTDDRREKLIVAFEACLPLVDNGMNLWLLNKLAHLGSEKHCLVALNLFRDFDNSSDKRKYELTAIFAAFDRNSTSKLLSVELEKSLVYQDEVKNPYYQDELMDIALLCGADKMPTKLIASLLRQKINEPNKVNYGAISMAMREMAYRNERSVAKIINRVKTSSFSYRRKDGETIYPIKYAARDAMMIYGWYDKGIVDSVKKTLNDLNGDLTKTNSRVFGLCMKVIVKARLQQLIPYLVDYIQRYKLSEMDRGQIVGVLSKLRSMEPANSNFCASNQNGLVQRYLPEQEVNYIGLRAFSARNWHVGEKLQIGNQQFTIESIRISGSGSKEHGTMASFDRIILAERPKVCYPAGTPVKHIGDSKLPATTDTSLKK